MEGKGEGEGGKGEGEGKGEEGRREGRMIFNWFVCECMCRRAAQQPPEINYFTRTTTTYSTRTDIYGS